ncbi:MAG: hypothetical protein ACP5N1_00985 [Candidatus Woesearchaeota archaeon]
MVKTTNDIMGITPLERIDKLEEISNEKKETIASKRKELEEFEKKKRKELDELEKSKKQELDQIDAKRKELEELESKKIKEIEETQELIERSFQELMRHKRILLQEEDIENKNKTEKKNKEINLEEVANTATKNIQKKDTDNSNYSKFFDNLQTPERIYDVTNNQFYNHLTELRDRASRGEITPEEERFVENLKNKFEQFNNNETYIEKDQNAYLKRSMNILEQIGKYHKLKID